MPCPAADVRSSAHTCPSSETLASGQSAGAAALRAHLPACAAEWGLAAPFAAPLEAPSGVQRCSGVAVLSSLPCAQQLSPAGTAKRLLADEKRDGREWGTPDTHMQLQAWAAIRANDAPLTRRAGLTFSAGFQLPAGSRPMPGPSRCRRAARC